jgi:hypothetical protein
MWFLIDLLMLVAGLSAIYAAMGILASLMEWGLLSSCNAAQEREGECSG